MSKSRDRRARKFKTEFLMKRAATRTEVPIPEAYKGTFSPGGRITEPSDYAALNRVRSNWQNFSQRTTEIFTRKAKSKESNFLKQARLVHEPLAWIDN